MASPCNPSHCVYQQHHKSDNGAGEHGHGDNRRRCGGRIRGATLPAAYQAGIWSMNTARNWLNQTATSIK